ncbi:E3 ubiquitin-protein ligase PPP1R11 isoform X2 [Topomyia yanbarensis]|uniref:E3 ubiquitin-protein ligase PPP1R11 isoform X2 n=1 Tax=Topomyia yanbarensis TaxID=2498891 RepID=UPI00273BBB22|nr:E3 ubiquitin-protein ligase PPP1R11 isoform X2 [Topomyia yanbarensis]
MSSEPPSLMIRSDVVDSVTITESLTQEQIPSTSTQQAPVLRLRLQKPRTTKQVKWTNGTVDNEHMNKKKSKCCCIYRKPTEFGESSSESEDECEHCFGHVEIKKKNKSDTDHGVDVVDSGGGQCEIITETKCSNGN